LKIVSKRYVPIPVAKRILDETAALAEGNPLVQRTYEYLTRFSKCDPDSAERAVRRLIEEVGLSELVAVNLVNIVPESVHEVRSIVEMESKVLETSKIEKILSILREECKA
jgi:DNA-directed RNA polymerase subunit F